MTIHCLCVRCNILAGAQLRRDITHQLLGGWWLGCVNAPQPNIGWGAFRWQAMMLITHYYTLYHVIILTIITYYYVLYYCIVITLLLHIAFAIISQHYKFIIIYYDIITTLL